MASTWSIKLAATLLFIAPANAQTPPPIDDPQEQPLPVPETPDEARERAERKQAVPPPSAPDAVAQPSTAGRGGYQRNDVIGAAEGVFGKGAEGLAAMVEKILQEQGEPVGYIAGREASAAFVVGLRYGSGTLTLKATGTSQPVYWTGPSIGFDVGGDATKVFTLVYNLEKLEDLYRRYPQAEGRAYFVGGFSGTYLRRDNVVLIPIRLGVGLRLGANVGYMKFSEKSRILPF